MPMEGYNGQVVIDTKTTWEEDAGSSGFLPKSRASMVFHELSENYYRTVLGYDYHPSRRSVTDASGKSKRIRIPGAHKSAIRDENSWHGKSRTPGEVAGVFRLSISDAEIKIFNFQSFAYEKNIWGRGLRW
jgi:hypothetical protein